MPKTTDNITTPYLGSLPTERAEAANLDCVKQERPVMGRPLRRIGSEDAPGPAVS